jgi:hypothetical protein
MVEEQNRIWDIAFKDVDYFMVIYPEGKVQNLPSSKHNKINFSVITSEEFKKLIMDGVIRLTVSRKSSDDKFQLRPNAGFHTHFPIKFTIVIPEVTLKDLNIIYGKDLRDWSNRVFGFGITKKMRSEVLQDIYDRREDIIKKLSSERMDRNY